MSRFGERAIVYASETFSSSGSSPAAVTGVAVVADRRLPPSKTLSVEALCSRVPLWIMTRKLRIAHHKVCPDFICSKQHLPDIYRWLIPNMQYSSACG